MTLDSVTTAKGSARISDTAGSATATITDPGMVTVSVGGASGTEGDELSFPVTLTGMVSSNVVLSWSTVAVTATSGEDYTPVAAGSLTIKAGDTLATVAVSTVEDILAEAYETFQVMIAATALPEGVSLGVPSANGTIEDDDGLTASVAANPLRVTEGDPATFPVTLTGGTSTADVVVTYSVAGTATSGDDYTAPSGTLTIGSPGTSGTITIATEADGVLDRGETLIVSLESVTTTKGSAELSATSRSATTTIGDSSTVTVSVAAATALEGESLSFPVTLSGAVSSEVELGWSTTAGTAISDTDYTAVASGSLTIKANDTSGTLTVSTSDDTLTEADETLTVTITGETLPPGVSLDVATATGTIEDDDGLTASVVANPLSVTEGGSATFPVTLTGGTSTADVVVTYSVEGTATSGVDYTAPSGTLRIAAAAASGTITIATTSDQVLEPGETLIVMLTGASTTGSAVVSDTAGLARAAITDPGNVTVSVGPASATEGESLSFPVTLSSAVSSEVELGWSTTAVTAISGTDYTAVSAGSLTIEATETSAMLTVSTSGDILTEGDETLTVTIAGTTLPSGVSLGVPTATGTIEDDNDLTASVTANPLSVAEGGPATFPVTLTGGTSTAEVVVTYSVTGMATSGDDYTAPLRTLTIERAAASGTITIVTLEDQVLEPSETLIVTLDSVTTAKGSARISDTAGSATATITDPGMVTVSVGGASGTEGDELSFPVTLTGMVSSNVVLSWSTVAVTATSGEDYTPVAAGSLTIKAGDTLATVAVSTVEDILAEAYETFQVMIAATALPEGVSLGVPSANGTIEDDDGLTASVAANPLRVTEGDPATFPVTLTGGTSTADVVVTYSVAGTATSGEDYTAPSGTLRIASAAASGTITIATTPDQVLEPGETLIVTLSGVTTAKGSAEVSETSASATTTITDPGTVTVTVSVGPASAAEGSAASFPVTLSGQVSSDVVLGWSTAPDTAVSGSDYTAVTSGSLRITAGQESGTLTVSTTEDALTEADEVFTVVITAMTLPTGVSLGVATATGKIEDDDDLTAAVAADADTVSEGSTATFRVSLTGGTSTADVRVAYSVGGTATSGDDYTAPPGTLTISSGSASGAVSIAISTDSVSDPDETIVVALTLASTANGNASVSTATATTTIVDASEPDRPVAATGTVMIDGTPVVGTTLTAVPSNVTDPDGVGAFTFKWLADGVEIQGATDETYLVTEDQLGSMVQVMLVYTDGLGVTKRLMSEPMGPVRKPASPPPQSPPSLAIVPGPSPVVEGSPVEFTLTRSHAETDLPAVEVAIAETGSVLAATTRVEVGFAPGETTSLLRLETVDDGVAEPDSEVRATLQAGTGYELGQETAAAVTVVDNDAAPGLTIEAASAIESAGVVEFVTRLSSAAVRPLSVAWETSDATALAGKDYVAASDVLTFAAGSTEARFFVQLIDDAIAEGDEHFLITFDDSAVTVAEPSLRATIVDDDPASVLVSLTLDRDRISEDEGPVALTVTAVLDRSARSVDTPVRIVVSGSGKPGAVDYRAAESFELTISEGELSGSVSFTLSPENDRVDELDETIDVSGTSVLPVISASLLLEDDDEPSLAVLLTVAPEVVPEDAGPTVLTVTASLDRSARVVETPVRIAVTGSGMPDVVGFEPVEAFTLTIPAERTTGVGTFVLTPVNDMKESYSATVKVGGEADLPVSAALLSLVDDDDASLAKAWLSRFARTVASQTVDTVEERLEARSASADPDARWALDSWRPRCAYAGRRRCWSADVPGPRRVRRLASGGSAAGRVAAGRRQFLGRLGRELLAQPLPGGPALGSPGPEFLQCVVDSGPGRQRQSRQLDGLGPGRGDGFPRHRGRPVATRRCVDGDRGRGLRARSIPDRTRGRAEPRRRRFQRRCWRRGLPDQRPPVHADSGQ